MHNSNPMKLVSQGHLPMCICGVVYVKRLIISHTTDLLRGTCTKLYINDSQAKNKIKNANAMTPKRIDQNLSSISAS